MVLDLEGRVTLGVVEGAGLIGRKRALDSLRLCDAVATMDTVTLAAPLSEDH